MDSQATPSRIATRYLAARALDPYERIFQNSLQLQKHFRDLNLIAQSLERLGHQVPEIAREARHLASLIKSMEATQISLASQSIGKRERQPGAKPEPKLKVQRPGFDPRPVSRRRAPRPYKTRQEPEKPSLWGQMVFGPDPKPSRVASRYRWAKRPHLNKEDPGSILALLKWLVVEKHGLRDLEPDIKALSRRINDEWQDYRSQ